MAEHYIEVGFSRQANQIIVGKDCEVYAGEHPENMRFAAYSDLNVKGVWEEIAV